ncbi:non-ribosomal peptide synthetase, partial [Streptomyces fuscichromogenes]|uniref:non-ribosomal peptide synthetase n=1 Tax=Streptomyces fuscichromogenes TaxID=1324013 RepID=UPI001E60629A
MNLLLAEDEAGRLRFVLTPHGIRQFVGPAVVPVLRELGAEPDPQAVVSTWVTAELTRPLDADAGPNSAMALFHDEAGYHYWAYAAHGLVHDSGGIMAVAQRLAGIYAALTADHDGGGTPLPSVQTLRDSAATASDGASPTGNLTFEDRPRAPLPTTRHTITLPRAVDPVTLCAAAAAYLSRLTGERDIALDRELPACADDGTVPNTDPTGRAVPLRLSISADADVATLLRNAATRLPATPVVVEEPPYRLVIRTAPTTEGIVFAGERATLHAYVPPPGGDAVLVLGEDGRRLDVHIRSGEAADDARAVFAEPLAVFLRAFTTADPATPLARLELLTPEQRHREVVTWNATGTGETGPPAATTVPRLLAEAATAHPDVAAVVLDDAVLSRADLEARSNRLARSLIERGVGPESVVAVVLDSGIDLVTALLAVLKAGGVYLPIDPRQPTVWTADLLTDASPVLVLTHTSVPLSDDIEWPAVMAMDDLPVPQGGDAPVADTDRRAPLLPDHPACLLHTSGSTGRPKGVLLTHRGITNLITWMNSVYRLAPEDRVLQKTPFVFSPSVWELFWPLSAGAAVVLVRPGGFRDPQHLADLIVRHRVTFAHFVPSMLEAFLDVPDAADCAGLRAVFCGGEALTPRLRDRFRAVLDVPLHNHYGPTETTVNVATWQSRDDRDGGTAPIGRPLANTRLHVLDGALRPVPPGVPGELYAAGAGLARGYLGQAGRTAERFVADPFAFGQRLYRTGDLARRRSDGVLEFLGRTDDQVKVRGYRIEPGAVQAALLTEEGVRDTAVVVREDTPGDRRLVAYVTGSDGLTGTGLRAHLAQCLPDHMVPLSVTVLPELPRTANGKLDRAGLPAPRYVTGAGGAPATVREEVLCELFAEVLGLPQVAVDDNFFDLGGHSLLAVSLAGLARARGVPVDVRTMFVAPTPARLAVETARAEAAVPASSIPPDADVLSAEMVPLAGLSEAELARLTAGVHGGARNVADVYPLAPLQEGLLFHHRLDTDGTADPYVLTRVWEFDTRARLDRFLTAWQTVVDRHDILRTAFAWEGLKRPVQVVHRHAPLQLTEVGIPSDGDPVDALLSVSAGPMDLRRAPLMTAHTAPLPDDTGRWMLALRTHHAIADHTTLDTVQQEVHTLLRGGRGELPDPVPYRTYVGQALLAARTGEHEEYFAGVLGDVDEPTVPFGVADVHGDGRTVFEADGHLDPRLAARVRRQARRLGVSPATLFHVVWARVLSAISGRDDVVFGTLILGRAGAGTGTDRVPGLFVNTLPVRVRIRAVSVPDAIASMQAQLAELMVHEHASLAAAQRVSGVAAPAPLFTALLNYQHADTRPAPQSTADDTGVRAVGSSSRTNYPLAVSVDDQGDGFRFAVQAVTPIDPETVLRLLQETTARLSDAVDDEHPTPLNHIDVLGEDELRRLLVLGNGTGAGTDSATLPDLFAARVARMPKATALLSGDERLTYEELDARSNRLARLLIRRGVGPESMVCTVLPRSPELVVALLAVMKAGGAYVPVDPDHPAEHVASLVAGVSPAAVLTARSVQHTGPDWIAVDDPALRDEGDSRPITDADRSGLLHPDLPAYVIHTSGSTGRPKGVVVSHAGLAGLAGVQAERLRVTEASRVLLIASPGFDASVWEICMALLNGACAVQATGDELLPGPAFLALARRHGVTHATLTPSVLALLPDGALPGVTLVAAGESLTPDLVRRWSLGRVLVNGYGPSETTVCVAMSDNLAGRTIPTIGRPTWNTRLYVLDPALRPVPVGVSGELYVSGRQLARGYLGRPDLTAERFVAHPFGAPGERLYRTGDLARWTADGELEFIGRADNQVKIRGVRVEPGEIEAVLAQCSGVAQTVVTMRAGRAAQEQLIAYVKAEDGVAVPQLPEIVREYAARRLPAAMVPAVVMVLDDIPLTRNGKIDRSRLPSPEFARVTGRGRAPAGPAEDILCGMFAEVLGLDRVGPDANFFHLGGHSLSATRLVARIQSAFAVDLPVRAVFEAPTAAGLARRLDGAASARDVIRPVRHRPEEIPLSFAQQRLWFLTQMGTPDATSGISQAYRLTGGLDVGALGDALRDVLVRHEVLRTRYVAVDGRPRQVVLAVEDLPAEVLSVVPVASADLTARVEEAASYAFDLSAEVPVRATLFVPDTGAGVA